MATIINKLLNGESFLSLLLKEDHFISKEQTEYNELQITLHAPGILEFTPSQIDQRAILYSSAIHGNETAPIEICDRLISKIILGDIKLSSPTLFIFGNLKSLVTSKRFVDYNLNRLFFNAHDQIDDCYEKKRANVISKYVEEFFNKYKDLEKIHFDLHTAIKESFHERFAIFPDNPKVQLSNEMKRILSSMDVDAILLAKGEATTFSYHTSKLFNATSFTVELGKVRPFGKNPKENFIMAENTLEDFLQGKEVINTENKISIYRVIKEIIKNDSTFKFTFGKETKNFTAFKKDELLYSQTSESYCIEKDNDRIIFPNENVINGARAGLIVRKE